MNVTSSTTAKPDERIPSAVTIERMGHGIVRYGLVVVLLWIGGMKFTAYEAEGIQVFIKNSPFFAWMNALLSVRGVSTLIGVTEIAVAALIATRPLSALAAAAGGGLATVMFLGTLSFMLTTPGVIEPSLGAPALSVVPGQFLVKDLVLLGASVWCFGEGLRAATTN